MNTSNLVERIEAFVRKYVAFEVPEVALPIALWMLGTHVFETFDAWAYIVITANTKRAGKTRLSEVISFVASNPLNFSAVTPSTLFRVMNPSDEANDEEKKAFHAPTIVFDEAESLSSEAASTMRQVLNCGYRKGQFIPRTVGKEVKNFQVFAPKIFILIGDVYDTLKDRSIVINMKRTAVPVRFIYGHAQAEGAELRAEVAKLFAKDDEGSPAPIIEKLTDAYLAQKAEFLSDRDEEIWLPILALCEVLCPERMRELRRTAVDLAGLKTAEKKVVKDLAQYEKRADQMDKAEKAAKDLLAVMGTEKTISSADAVVKLKEIDLAQWRTYAGTGLDQHLLGDLLASINIPSVNVRFGKKVLKGYRKLDVETVLGKIANGSQKGGE